MGVLAEFVRAEAEHLRAEVGKRKQAFDEWLESINKLNAQLAGWVAEADGGTGLLQANPTQELTRQEALLGVYGVRGLSITLGGRLSGRSADVVPRARYVAATIRPPGQEPSRADGMVEIKEGATAVYYLFRRSSGSGDEWFIREVGLWDSEVPAGRVDPLTRDRFEAAVLSILK